MDNMSKLKVLLGLMATRLFPGYGLHSRAISEALGEEKKPKKKMGPGVGTNRMRRFREGKNW